MEKLLINVFNSNFTGQPPSLLFPSGSDIRRLGLDGNGTGSYSLVAHSQGAMGGFDVWWEKKLVFWTDLRRGTIKRARIPGGAAAKVLTCGRLAVPRGHRLVLLYKCMRGFAPQYLQSLFTKRPVSMVDTFETVANCKVQNRARAKLFCV